ncbi:MAG: hypothetical protein LBK65_00765 [Tannerellaceae bacterium]|jgi:hypothetical protein|nr:hypothetical protein [Tannerellaceae bacterium]
MKVWREYPILNSPAIPAVYLNFVNPGGENLVEGMPVVNEGQIATQHLLKVYIKGEGIDETKNYGLDCSIRMIIPENYPHDLYYEDVDFLKIHFAPFWKVQPWMEGHPGTYYIRCELSCNYLFGTFNDQILEMTVQRASKGMDAISNVLFNGKEQFVLDPPGWPNFYQIIVE